MYRLLQLPSLCVPVELYQDIFCITPDSAEEVPCHFKIDKSKVPEIDLVSATRILASSNLFPIFSSARNPTRASTLMRLLFMGAELQAAILCADTLRRLTIFFFSTFPSFPSVSVLRLLEGSCVTLPFPLKIQSFLHSLWQPTLFAYTSIRRRVCSHQGQQLPWQLFGIPPSPRGVPQVEVIFDIWCQRYFERVCLGQDDSDRKVQLHHYH